MSAIHAHQEQILATQTQHTAILRQLQHHLGLPSAAEHLTPTTAVPHSGGHHRCISSTGHYYCLIISLLLSLHIILVYIIPCFDVLYFGIGCITDDTSYIDIIFLFKLDIFLFLLLTNSYVFFETCGFSYTTRTPCHSGGTTSSLLFNRCCHIEDNVQLGWGES